jgi:hypothetical protein
MWTQQEAIALCREIEAMCPAYGFHVALTGGLLYKDGERKDLDLILYRIRQRPLEEIDFDGFSEALRELGFADFKFFGFCVKSTCNGKPVDLLFPEPCIEYDGGGYPVHEVPPNPEPIIAALEQIEAIGQS